MEGRLGGGTLPLSLCVFGTGFLACSRAVCMYSSWVVWETPSPTVCGKQTLTLHRKHASSAPTHRESPSPFGSTNVYFVHTT